MPSEKLLVQLAAIGVTVIGNRKLAPSSPGTLRSEKGYPIRRDTLFDFGLLLLGHLLDLNKVQNGVLQLVFKIANDNALLLLDMKELRAIVQYVGDHAKQFQIQYGGNISAASIDAIQRVLPTLEEQGANRFFGELMLDINDLMRTDADAMVSATCWRQTS